MPDFQIHTLASAPAPSQPALQTVRQALGFIPHIAGAMAGSPPLINSFIGVFRQVHGGSFTEAQIQTVLLTNAVTNASPWAAAFHTFLALKEGLDPADVEAIRQGRLPADGRHAALSALAKNLIETRGHVDTEMLRRFTGAGFSREQVLETIGIVAASTMTNYTGNVAAPPLEEAFQRHTWPS